MSDTRKDFLAGFQAGGQALSKLRVQTNYLTPSGRIDVYSVAANLDIPVMFRGLDGLLGAYLPTPIPGILISTNRPHSVQRLTCAHELGHFWLKHGESLDDDSTIGSSYAHPSAVKSMELQADAFAFSFLMPRWLVISHVGKLAKAGLNLPEPEATYQLSLRLGCSYAATVNTLEGYNFISRPNARKLRAIEPRTIKQRIAGNIVVPDWHRDVWLIPSLDEENFIDAAPGDLIVSRIPEPTTAGYVTNLNNVDHRFTVVNNRLLDVPNSGDFFGGFPTREIAASCAYTGINTLRLVQARPWEPADRAQVVAQIDVRVRGTSTGLSDEERHHHLQAVAQG